MQRVLKELSDAIGLADAIEICRRWGGRDFNVPMHVKPHDPLALTLGYESASKLVAAFGGVRLQLPAERNALLDLRNVAIFRACEVDGKSQERVGLEFGLTRQGVKKVIRTIRDRGGIEGLRVSAYLEEDEEAESTAT